MLKEIGGIAISTKTVQNITEDIGAKLCIRRDKATRAYLSGETSCPKPAKPVKLIVVSADGGRVQTRQDDPGKRWKESKVAIAYDTVPARRQPGKKYAGPSPHTRSVIVTLDNWDTLGDHLSAQADARGYAHAHQKVFISDGAAAIRSQRERCFPDAAFILDWIHAVEHLHAVAIAQFGPGKQADAWWEKNKTRLWEGRIHLILKDLRSFCRQHGEPPKGAADSDPRKILANNRDYFIANRDGLDYPTFRKNGWPVASGVTEATVKQLGLRVKASDKHWNVSGAEQTLQVVACMISNDGRWQDFWASGPGSKAA